ncbi:amidase domain-containing protein [Streptomyces sp. NPDC050658]|uniref:amidase domain-containing protein n=1 Tax=unclassified Streptomyces TaxID=2593676 RepID=UPI003438225B
MAVAAIAGMAGGVLATAPAGAAPSDEARDRGTLVETAQTYLTGENSLRVEGGATDATKAAEAADELKVAGTFAKVRDDRMTAREQQRQLAELTGVRFTGVSTQVVPLGNVRKDKKDENTVRLSVEERTRYTYAQADVEPYSYRARHELTFKDVDGAWRLSSLVTKDPTGMNTPKKLSDAQLRTAVKTTEKLKEGLRKTAEKRKAASEARLSGAKGSGGNSTKDIPDGLDYQKMVDWALRYALEDRDKLPYTPDEDDCTTFVSWALRTGGWAEQSGFYQNDDVWWWKDWCDGEWYCRPQHSYTWGGATNFQRYAVNESKRVNLLGNVWDVRIADVMQYDVKGYGGEGVPDHTMMVTAFDWNADGMPLLSYHSSPGGEQKNKPLIDILNSDSAQGQAFWAYGT